MTSCRGYNRNNGRRLVYRALNRVFYGCVRAAFVVAIRRKLVRNEHRVEQAPLHRARHVLPVAGPRPVPVNFVLWMAPHSCRMTIYAMLDKSEEVSALLDH